MKKFQIPKALSMYSDFYYRIKNRIKGLSKSTIKLPPDNARRDAELHPEGQNISVETALNSRCNSDYNRDQEHFHWGMFDKQRKLTRAQVKMVITSINVPNFTSYRARVRVEGNLLIFSIGNNVPSDLWDRVMVESGMQHQATGLICAALGIGMVFKSLGDERTTTSDSDYSVMSIWLDAMNPSYNGSYWSTIGPYGKMPWKTGNMPDPQRKGNVPLLAALRELRTERSTGRVVTEASLSQLLWAARGRTPHLYKSKPWGMTIPVSRGEQDISCIYVISGNKLFKYVNMEGSRPTHSLLLLNELDALLVEKFSELFPPEHKLIILSKNKLLQRANWEIGYQLLNLMLQAHSLELTYRTFFVDANNEKLLILAGILNPMVIFSV